MRVDVKENGVGIGPEFLPFIFERFLLADLQIIVLDDNPEMSDFLRFLLEKKGAVAQTFKSVSECLSALEKYTPDIILSEVSPFMICP